MIRSLWRAACAAILGLPGCSDAPAEDETPQGVRPCPSAVAPPRATPLVRIEPRHADSDPLATRLCEEGATPLAELGNPWDLHCEIASGPSDAIATGTKPPERLRIVEWNVKFGTDLEGVASLLESHPILSAADVLLLVEVDRGCDRSGRVDVARTLGQRLGMDWVYGVEFVEYAQGGCEEGNAILARHPLGNPIHGFHDVGKLERGALHAPYDWSLDQNEPRSGRRSYVGADLEFGGGLLFLVSAHLENRSDASERADEIGEILSRVSSLPRRSACIAGDFNVFPDIGASVVDAPLFDLFASACFENPHAGMPQPERRTRPNNNYQIDFTYVRALVVEDRGVVNDLDPVPSDHFPVWVDVSAER